MSRAAEQLLIDLIPDGDEVPGAAIRVAARDAGIPETTLRRAAAKLGITIERRGFGQGSVWRYGGNRANGANGHSLQSLQPSSGGMGGNGVPYGDGRHSSHPLPPQGPTTVIPIPGFRRQAIISHRVRGGLRGPLRLPVGFDAYPADRGTDLAEMFRWVGEGDPPESVEIAGVGVCGDCGQKVGVTGGRLIRTADIDDPAVTLHVVICATCDGAPIPRVPPTRRPLPAPPPGDSWWDGSRWRSVTEQPSEPVSVGQRTARIFAEAEEAPAP